MTALESKQDISVVEHLLSLKADPNQAGRDGSGELFKPFEYAFMQTSYLGAPLAEFSKIAKLLHSYKASVDATLDQAYTPLMMAAEYCESDLVKVLLGLNADPDKRNDDQKTAADLACSNSEENATVAENLKTLLRSQGKRA